MKRAIVLSSFAISPPLIAAGIARYRLENEEEANMHRMPHGFFKAAELGSPDAQMALAQAYVEAKK